MEASWFFIGLIISYLLGSIPTAVIVSKFFFGFDIRTRGSGNMGSTNVFRELGAFWGIVVQVVDIAKGFIPVAFIASEIYWLYNNNFLPAFLGETGLKIIYGLVAVGGHIFSVFVGFRGGKGINTAMGMLLAITPLEVFICVGVFLLVFFASGYVSLGSIIAVIFYPSTIFFRYYVLGYEYQNFSILAVFSLFLLLLILFTHRSNIKRLLSGTENKFDKLQIFKFSRKNK
ncbi:MAG: glycerol-3-phosphate 1-O-acyltransferase PlsY [Ignavibacteria bacterium]|nr:glycerol-3-phosphate 1-O-acyltransferase PlsY [Ignavibacteria bacterium]